MLQVVLAHVHVAHRRLRQRLGEARPGCNADLEVFAHVQRPDALAGQDLAQVLQLRIPHTLLWHKAASESVRTLWLTQACAPLIVWQSRGLFKLPLVQLQWQGQRAHKDPLIMRLVMHLSCMGLPQPAHGRYFSGAHPLKVLDVEDLHAGVGSQGVQYGIDVRRAHIRGDVLLQAQHAPVRLELAGIGADQVAQPRYLLVLHAQDGRGKRMSDDQQP